MKNNLKIRMWLRRGRFSRGVKTVEDVIYEAGEMLDDAEAHDIVGETLFKAADGKWYTVTVEAVVAKANPTYVKNALLDRKAPNDIDEMADVVLCLTAYCTRNGWTRDQLGQAMRKKMRVRFPGAKEIFGEESTT